jgi:hypothetical protein
MAQRFNPTVRKLRIASMVAGIERKLEAVARQSIQEISSNVVDDTPLDTGFLKGSWQPSLGAPKRDKGINDPGGAKAKADVAIAVAELRAGDTFYMINNAKYARRLEYGFVGQDSLGRSYNQQGRFFVARNVRRWRSIVKRIVAQLKDL